MGRLCRCLGAPAHSFLINVQMKRLNILVACEESQAETYQFRLLGHRAFSCDIKPCRKGGHPEWHIQDDVSPYLGGLSEFKTIDGKKHRLRKWDLIIAHPPCTYLCKVSSVHMVHDGRLNEERFRKMWEARSFFFKCLNAQADYVAVENPLPMARARLPKPSCFVQPSWFGHKYTKKTLYWLKNLPPIMAGASYPNPKEFVRSSRGIYRSRTFEGVARALAEQWSNFILDDLQIHNAVE